MGKRESDRLGFCNSIKYLDFNLRGIRSYCGFLDKLEIRLELVIFWFVCFKDNLDYIGNSSLEEDKRGGNVIY